MLAEEKNYLQRRLHTHTHTHTHRQGGKEGTTNKHHIYAVKTRKMAPQSSTSQLAHPPTSSLDDTDDMMSEGVAEGVGELSSMLSPSVAAVAVGLAVGAIPKHELEQEENTAQKRNCDHHNVEKRPVLALESSPAQAAAIARGTYESANSSNNDDDNHNITNATSVHGDSKTSRAADLIASDDLPLSPQDTASSSSSSSQQEAASTSEAEAKVSKASESPSSPATVDADSVSSSIPKKQQTEHSQETKEGGETTTHQHEETKASEEQQQAETTEESNSKPTLVDYARRGAVGAVGATMTAVGLVMIPLPTPFGAVIASSGLAVLGTEFKGAKDLNDKLIEGAKHHVNTAREYMVRSIESMEDTSEHNIDRDHTDDGTIATGSCGSQKGQDDATASGLKVILVERGESTISDAATESTAQQDIYDEEDDVKDEFDSSDANVSDVKRDDVGYNKTRNNITNKECLAIEQPQEPPKWLHMNQVERERQERLARLKYERESKSNIQHAKESLIKKTGLSTFLSRNLLPVLKGTSSNVGEDNSSNSKMIDAASSTSAEMTKGDDQQHNNTNASSSQTDKEDDGGFIVVNASCTQDS